MTESGVAAPIRVVIADDHPALQVGSRLMLETQADIVVVGTAETGEGVVAQVATLAPQVVLLDIQLQEGDGLVACRQIRGEHPAVAVVMYTASNSEAHLAEAWAAGAAGYLGKEVGPTTLADSVRKAARGERAWTVSQELRVKAWQRMVLAPLESLSPREQEVFWLLVRGATNPEIASQLVITEKTVEVHVSRVIQKLGLTTRREVRAWALAAQLPLPKP
jgi:DNA-binding NarL/FixJ family response regulator